MLRKNCRGDREDRLAVVKRVVSEDRQVLHPGPGADHAIAGSRQQGQNARSEAKPRTSADARPSSPEGPDPIRHTNGPPIGESSQASPSGKAIVRRSDSANLPRDPDGHIAETTIEIVKQVERHASRGEGQPTL